VWAAQKKAMHAYLSMKRFYAEGVFYGLDETLHAHTLPDVRESVINAFNLAEQPARKQVKFRLAEIGLPPGSVKVEGASCQQHGDEITVDLEIPARGQVLLRIGQARGSP
jgi:hypothetical protein